MFEGLSFDELNKLIPNKRSMDFEKYFGEMELTEDEIQKRIELAEKLENEFIFVFALLFTMQQYNFVDWERARQEYVNRYLSVLPGYVTITSYIQNYIELMSYNIIDSTKKHEAEYYYYSLDRARFMAECEANNGRSYQCNEDALSEGKTYKLWITMGDKKVRKTHKEIGGTSKPINEPFYVGGALMMYPRDTQFSPPVSETAGCRCSIKYF